MFWTHPPLFSTYLSTTSTEWACEFNLVLRKLYKQLNRLKPVQSSRLQFGMLIENWTFKRAGYVLFKKWSWKCTLIPCLPVISDHISRPPTPDKSPRSTLHPLTPEPSGLFIHGTDWLHSHLQPLIAGSTQHLHSKCANYTVKPSSTWHNRVHTASLGSEIIVCGNSYDLNHVAGLK